MSRVRPKFRSGHAHERPTGPRAPAALVAARLVHPVGIVLKMHARISDKYVRGRLSHEPFHGRKRQRPLAQHRFVAPEIGPERAIEAEERARGQAALPEGVTILQTIQVELGPAFRSAMRVQRPPVEPSTRHGEMRTGRQRGHGRVGGGPRTRRQSSLSEHP